MVVSFPGEWVAPFPYAPIGDAAGGQMRKRRNIRKTESHQIWELQRPRLGNVSKCCTADVAIIRRVGQFADAHAIQDNPDDAFKIRHRQTSFADLAISPNFLAFCSPHSSTNASVPVAYAAVIETVDHLGEGQYPREPTVYFSTAELFS